MNKFLTTISLIACQVVLQAQVLTFSNLPIIDIDTEGKVIFDEPKITANMRIIYNQVGNNILNQDSAHYSGTIGIELRGQSSQSFPKKGYGIETRDDTGEDESFELLDMPMESDWVIHSPYSDKSLIRNALAYQIAGEIMDYGPRVKLAELVLNNQYQGVVLWTEKIKRDKNRVDINKLKADDNEGDDLTGGYIIKFDKGDGREIGWSSPYDPITGRTTKTNFLFHYPKPADITNEQSNYIQEYVTNFENVLMSSDFDDPESGYRKYIDVSSFVELMIVNELSRNVDGYRLSTYMYKDKDSNGGKLTMGPVWDYNLAFGNADYCSGGRTNGWAYDFNSVCPSDFWVNHVWWKRLLQDEGFRQELKDTWQSLRADVLSDESLMNRVDSLTTELSSAQQRNFNTWRVLGQYVWPNNFVGQTYSQEITYLKNWILDRTLWLDDNIRGLTTPTKETFGSNIQIFPNPSSDYVTIDLNELKDQPNHLELYDGQGKLLLYNTIQDRIIKLNIGQIQSQILFIRLFKGNQLLKIHKIIKTQN